LIKTFRESHGKYAMVFGCDLAFLQLKGTGDISCFLSAKSGRGRRFLSTKEVLPMEEILMILAAIANIGSLILELYQEYKRKEGARKKKKRQG